jgi:hypothetical protein
MFFTRFAYCVAIQWYAIRFLYSIVLFTNRFTLQAQFRFILHRAPIMKDFKDAIQMTQRMSRLSPPINLLHQSVCDMHNLAFDIQHKEGHHINTLPDLLRQAYRAIRRWAEAHGVVGRSMGHLNGFPLYVSVLDH